MYVFVLSSGNHALKVFADREYIIDLLNEFWIVNYEIQTDSISGNIFADFQYLPQEILMKYQIPKCSSYRLSKAILDSKPS